MNPIGLVKQFHKLSRTVEFDLFGFLNLEILNFKVGSSTDFIFSILNREIQLWIMFKSPTSGTYMAVTQRARENDLKPDERGPPVSLSLSFSSKRSGKAQSDQDPTALDQRNDGDHFFSGAAAPATARWMNLSPRGLGKSWR